MPDDMIPEGDDFSGFVIAVEAGFDPNYSSDYAEESAGFTGQLHVLGAAGTVGFVYFCASTGGSSRRLVATGDVPEYPWKCPLARQCLLGLRR